MIGYLLLVLVILTWISPHMDSGTEPKFKYYIEMKGKVGVPRETIERELKEMSEIIIQELVKPKEHGLTVPGANP